ncbi:MAG: rhodanese-like domain-containing protein [Nitrosomonas sp.]|nr:rhodanese-like domain-containing protein [Nitrosomonas sp.]
MQTIKAFLAIALLGLVIFVMACIVSPKIFTKTAYALVKLEFEDIPEFSGTSLHQLSRNNNDSGYIIVDVRTPEERNVSIIDGAIDQESFERNRSVYQNQRIIVYCTIGYRSGFYTRSLRQEGFDAYNLSEGILGWTHINGRLLNHKKQPTKQVHVYSRPWNLGVKNGVAVF